MLNRARILALTGLAAILACGTIYAANTNAGSATTTGTTASPAAAKPEISQSDILRVSEAFGHFIGRNLNTPGIKFDLESIIKGMRDGAAGKPAPMSDKDYEQLMTRIQESAFQKLSAENLKAANEFLDKNVKEKGVVVVQPGKLQYLIIKEGTGPAVVAHGSPQINYTGKFLDDKVFGSSEENGEPITIPLDQTIPGFSLGIIGMKEGEKRRLFVHPELGYGTAGHLPPNSLLIFDIELVKAEAPQQADADDEEDDDDDLSPLGLTNSEDKNANPKPATTTAPKSSNSGK